RVSAELGWIDPETAIFESATACGIRLLRPDQLDPLRTTTRGVGELIWEAGERGAKSVVVGLGGSATVDGGTGMARGLGWTFRDSRGAALLEGGGALADLTALEGGWSLPARVIGLADVTTPLVGPDGGAPGAGGEEAGGRRGREGRGPDRSARARWGGPDARRGRGGGARRARDAASVRVARRLAAGLSSRPYAPRRQPDGQARIALQAA